MIGALFVAGGSTCVTRMYTVRTVSGIRHDNAACRCPPGYSSELRDCDKNGKFCKGYCVVSKRCLQMTTQRLTRTNKLMKAKK